MMARSRRPVDWPGVPQRRTRRYGGTLRHRLSSIARGHSSLDDVTERRDGDHWQRHDSGDRRRAGGGGRIPNQLHRAAGFCLAAARLVPHLDFHQRGYVAGEYQFLAAWTGDDSHPALTRRKPGTATGFRALLPEDPVTVPVCPRAHARSSTVASAMAERNPVQDPRRTALALPQLIAVSI